MKALRNSGYRYLKYRVYGKPLGYGILGAYVSDNAITLSLIIKDNNREDIIWKSAEREFHDYQSCVDAIKDCEAEIFDKSPIAFKMNKDVRYDFEENPDVTYLNCEV